jgi:hypothetical protein
VRWSGSILVVHVFGYRWNGTEPLPKWNIPLQYRTALLLQNHRTEQLCSSTCSLSHSVSPSPDPILLNHSATVVALPQFARPISSPPSSSPPRPRSHLSSLPARPAVPDSSRLCPHTGLSLIPLELLSNVFTDFELLILWNGCGKHRAGFRYASSSGSLLKHSRVRNTPMPLLG